MNKRHSVAGVLLAVAVSGTAFSATGQPAQAAGPNYFAIVNYGSGKCAGLSPAEYENNGARVIQQTCNGQPEQQWAPVALGGGNYQWLNARSGKCMDVTDGRNADRTPIQQWDCTNTSGMSWNVAGAIPTPLPVRVVSKIGGRCLDVAAGSWEDGARIQTYRCTSGNTAQAWLIHQ
ncbi:RICIN domain-containing protein [Streptomyces sp. NPDC026206]|uniref:RICIN domain-containing protein n=1 Tax=Streptomyces sp. NPDC026206 TaxID=3157089 RepID=UPI0033DAF131